jgi:O-antigen/teichoic acid export membrane protein
VSTRGIARNTGVSTAVYLIGSASGLVVVPILLRTLGATQFGLYVLAQTILTFSSLATGGFNRGFVRSIVAHTKREGPRGARPVVATAVSLMASIALVVLFSITLLAPVLARLFRVPPPLTTGFAWILAGATLSYAFMLSVTPYQAVLVACGRLDVSKSIEAGLIVGGAAASAYAALAGFGLRGVGVALASVALPAALATFIAACRTDPRTASVRPRLHPGIVRELWHFGSRIQLVALAGMINRSVDRVSLGLLRSPASVAVYDVADRGAFSIVYTANTLAEALAPRMAAHIATDDTAGARDTYSKATCVFSFAAISMAGFAGFQASTILSVWLGRSDASSIVAMAFLAAGYGVAVSLSAANLVATAQAKPTLAMRYSLVQATVNVALSLLGAWLAGIRGAAAGSALSGGIGALVFAVLVERAILQAPALVGPRTLLRSALTSLPIAAILAYATWWVAAATHAGRLLGLVLLGVAFLLQIALTLPIALRTGLIPVSAVPLPVRRLRLRRAG